MTKIEIKYGIIFSLASLVWVSMEYVLGLHSTFIELHPMVSPLFATVAITVMYLGMSARKKAMGGQVTYFEIFMSGLYISIVVVLLSPIPLYIFNTHINPDFFESMTNLAVNQGKMPLEQAQEYFSYMGYVKQSIVGGLVMGVITSAIVALFLRSKPKKEGI